jgi:NADH-quinone oxidoreductase subunit M
MIKLLIFMLSIIYLIIPPICGLIVLTLLKLSNLYINFFSFNKNNIFKGITLYFFSVNFFFFFYFIYFFKKIYYGFQFSEIYNFFNFTILFGVDGISLFFLFLTVFLMPICILLSWDYINIKVYEYLISFLFLEIFLVLFFSSLNLLILYVSFESILIPMFIIIGFWGGKRKIKASYYLFIYTLIGSIFLLLAILII